MIPSVVHDAHGHIITPETILGAYHQRCFPMADHRHGLIDWYQPTERAIITWDKWRIPRSLRKRAAQNPYTITINKAFPEVIRQCAQRETTWINPEIEQLYTALQSFGIAHSVEAWDGAELAGGLYGLSIGGCFCGESMFYKQPDASKLCVINLVERLQFQGYSLLDCQQQTPHMQRFGAYEVDDGTYRLLFDKVKDEHHNLL